MSMRDLIGKEVKIGEKEGEITNVLGVGYEVTFFNVDYGKTFIDARNIDSYLADNCITEKFSTVWQGKM